MLYRLIQHACSWFCLTVFLRGDDIRKELSLSEDRSGGGIRGLILEVFSDDLRRKGLQRGDELVSIGGELGTSFDCFRFRGLLRSFFQV